MQWFPGFAEHLRERALERVHDGYFGLLEFAVSPRLLQLLGYGSKPQPDAEIGLPYIHGVEPKEGPLHRPLQNFEGGTLLVGCKTACKTFQISGVISVQKLPPWVV